MPKTFSLQEVFVWASDDVFDLINIHWELGFEKFHFLFSVPRPLSFRLHKQGLYSIIVNTTNVGEIAINTVAHNLTRRVFTQ